jgi:hypothetical protein
VCGFVDFSAFFQIAPEAYSMPFHLSTGKRCFSRFIKSAEDPMYIDGVKAPSAQAGKGDDLPIV